MPISYRNPGVRYRDVGTNYRGTVASTPAVPGIDLDRLDYIRVYTVDQFGKRLGQLSSSVITKVSWALNDAGTCELYVSKYDPGLGRIGVLQNELQVVFTNTNPHELWWGFPVGQELQSGQNGSNHQTYTLEGLFSYFKYRIVEHGTLTYTSEDQFDIAWNLIQTAQTGVNYDRNIGASYLPSGVTRSRSYARDQHSYIFDILQTFNADKLVNGFDQDIVVNETGQRLWTPYYPAKGSWYQGYLEWGKDIIDYDLKYDGRQMRTKLYCTGGSNGSVKFEQSYENVAASNKYGALVGVVSDGSEQDLSWLLAKAQQQVAVRSQAISQHQIIVTADKLGKIHPGDSVWVRIDDGMNQCNAPFRVQVVTWLQNETIQLDFVPPNLTGFTTPGAQPPL